MESWRSCVRAQKVVQSLAPRSCRENRRDHRTSSRVRCSCPLATDQRAPNVPAGSCVARWGDRHRTAGAIRDSAGWTARGACRSRRARGHRLALRRRPAVAEQRCNGVANSCSPERRMAHCEAAHRVATTRLTARTCTSQNCSISDQIKGSSACTSNVSSFSVRRRWAFYGRS